MCRDISNNVIYQRHNLCLCIYVSSWYVTYEFFVVEMTITNFRKQNAQKKGDKLCKTWDKKNVLVMEHDLFSKSCIIHQFSCIIRLIVI